MAAAHNFFLFLILEREPWTYVDFGHIWGRGDIFFLTVSYTLYTSIHFQCIETYRDKCFNSWFFINDTIVLYFILFVFPFSWTILMNSKSKTTFPCNFYHMHWLYRMWQQTYKTCCLTSIQYKLSSSFLCVNIQFVHSSTVHNRRIRRRKQK